MHKRKNTPTTWTKTLKGYHVHKHRALGEGGQSKIYEGRNKSTGERVVVKVSKTKEDAREAAILRRVHSGPNIISLLDMVKADSEHILILESLGPQSHVMRSFSKLSGEDVRYYFCKLLIALEYCHSRGVIHGDVKNGNVIYNPRTKALRLIDFGHSSFHSPKKPKRRWMGTPTYKAPEVLLHYPKFDYAVDMWASGILLSRALIDKRFLMPLQKDGKPNLTHSSNLRLMISFLGTTGYRALISKYNLKEASSSNGLPYGMLKEGKTSLPSNPVPIGLFSPQVRNVNDDRAVDLIVSLLILDPAKRLTSTQALDHDYLASIRQTTFVSSGVDEASSSSTNSSSSTATRTTGTVSSSTNSSSSFSLLSSSSSSS